LFCQILPGTVVATEVSVTDYYPSCQLNMCQKQRRVKFTISANNRTACVEDTGQLAMCQTIYYVYFPYKNGSALRAYIHY